MALLASAFIGTGLKAAGQYKQLKNQSEMHAYNAAVARRNGELARRVGAFEAQRIREEKEIFLSAQTAKFAKSGVRFEGTPMQVIAQTAYSFEMDVASTLFNSEVEARFQESQAQIDSTKSRLARSQATTQALMTLTKGLGQAAFQSGLGQTKSVNQPTG